MRVMVIVKATPETENESIPDDVMQKMFTEMGNYNEQLVNAGIMKSGEGLHPSSRGKRIKFSGEKRTVVDGPFAEAKELIAGFWLIQAASKAEAIDWAKRAPFHEGEVELRQVFEAEDFPVDPAEQPDGWRQKEKEFREAQIKKSVNR